MQGNEPITPKSNDQIKALCELYYNRIKEAEDGLNQLRSEYTHEKTFEGDYSYRVGVIMPAKICSYCNQLIKYI